MAKGEGGEQYSNASLLNKQPSLDDIKLAKKVGSFILFTDDNVAVWWFYDKTQKQRAKEGFCRLKASGVWMNGPHRPANWQPELGALCSVGVFGLPFKNQFKSHMWSS